MRETGLVLVNGNNVIYMIITVLFSFIMTGCNGVRLVGGWCCLMAIVFITSQLVQVSDAQAYHFSKGWMPGRKRSDSQVVGQPGPGARSSLYGELDRRSTEDCAVKLKSYRLAVDVLKARDFSYS